MPVASTCGADNTSNVGNAIYPITNAGQTASGTCNTGYGGTASRLCQSDGSWAGSATQSCTRLTCPATTMGNANFALTNSMTTGYGTCLSGYSGSPSSACSNAGTWGGVSNACTRTQHTLTEV